MTVEVATGADGGTVTSLDAQRAERRAWELAERVAELESQLAELGEREYVRELELAAARRDLDVKAAYNTMLESAALERQQAIQWLQAQLTQASNDVSEQRTRADEERNRGDEQRNRAEGAEAFAASLRAELAAERARLSYRIVNRFIRASQRVPVLRGLMRAVMRVSGRRGPRPVE